MLHSSRYSYLVLRLGLAAVFLWFGVDKFLHPAFWVDAFVPTHLVHFVERFGITAQQLMYLQGIFEVLVGLSLVIGVFTKLFAFLAAALLLCVLIFAGKLDITVRDIGLVGGLLSIVLWPRERRR